MFIAGKLKEESRESKSPGFQQPGMCTAHGSVSVSESRSQLADTESKQWGLMENREPLFFLCSATALPNTSILSALLWNFPGPVFWSWCFLNRDLSFPTVSVYPSPQGVFVSQEELGTVDSVPAKRSYPVWGLWFRGNPSI